MRKLLLLLLMLTVLWGRLWVGGSSAACCCGEECCCAALAAQAEHGSPAQPSCPCDCGEKEGAHYEPLPLAWQELPAAPLNQSRPPVPPVAYRELTEEEIARLRPCLSAALSPPPPSESCALPALYAGFDSPLRA